MNNHPAPKIPASSAEQWREIAAYWTFATAPPGPEPKQDAARNEIIRREHRNRWQYPNSGTWGHAADIYELSKIPLQRLVELSEDQVFGTGLSWTAVMFSRIAYGTLDKRVVMGGFDV